MKKKSFKSTVIEFIITALAAIIVFVVVSQFIQIGRVSGRSMDPTYQNGELVMINKFRDDFESGQVVTFEYSEVEEQYYDQLMGNATSFGTVADGDFHIKRIVGMPGDVVLIENSVLYINSEKISETDMYIPNQSYIIGADQYFVQGDNIDNSFDSRLHGPVPAESIIGVVMTE